MNVQPPALFPDVDKVLLATGPRSRENGFQRVSETKLCYHATEKTQVDGADGVKDLDYVM